MLLIAHGWPKPKCDKMSSCFTLRILLMEMPGALRKEYGKTTMFYKDIPIVLSSKGLRLVDNRGKFIP